MNESWLNIDWFKRKTLHEYQSGGKDSALNYLEDISEAISDSDYVLLLEYIKIIKLTLESVDYSVITAHSGFEAGALLHKHMPSIITLDLKIPGLDGMSVLKSSILQKYQYLEIHIYLEMV